MFTARYELSPCVKQIRLVLKGLIASVVTEYSFLVLIQHFNY